MLGLAGSILEMKRRHTDVTVRGRRNLDWNLDSIWNSLQQRQKLGLARLGVKQPV